jgi:hypothetical protein
LLQLSFSHISCTTKKLFIFLRKVEECFRGTDWHCHWRSQNAQAGGRDAQPLSTGSSVSLWGVHYNLGGPSYILNRSALRRVVEEGLPYYFTDVVNRLEDAVMGAILAVMIHIHLVDTSDAANNRQRFHKSVKPMRACIVLPSLWPQKDVVGHTYLVARRAV